MSPDVDPPRPMSLGRCVLHGLPRELWGGLAVCPACESASRQPTEQPKAQRPGYALVTVRVDDEEWRQTLREAQLYAQRIHEHRALLGTTY